MGVRGVWEGFGGVRRERKLAGSPPCSLIISIVAIARPAPFTVGVTVCVRQSRARYSVITET